MSVYTTLTLTEVQDFSSPYGLEVIDLIPIQGGIQNTNYFLVTKDGSQFVLTVFEEMDEHGAGELVPVLEHLGKAGLAVPVPLNHSGNKQRHTYIKRVITNERPTGQTTNR